MIWRTFKYSVLVSVGLIFCTHSAVYAEPSKSDLAKIEKQVKEQEKEHQRLQAQAVKINMEISSISKEMVKRASIIQNQEDKLSKMERELKKLAEELEKAEEEFKIQDENLIRTLSAMQNLALKPTESLLVQPLTPVEVIRSAMLLRETIPVLEQTATKIRKDLEEIEKKKKQIEEQAKKIGEQNKKLEKEQVKLKDLASKKDQVKKAVENKTVKAKQEIDKLAGKAKDLRDLLNKIGKGETDDQKALRKSIDKLGNAFAKAKGNLSMPARGAVIIYYGQEVTKGNTSKGITIQTRNYAQVTSIFDGIVIFTGPFRGYGNMIIVEHGEGYVSLLAGLDSIDCETGQLLLAGEPIGMMAEGEETNLYVELRKDGKPINPLSWIKR